MRTCWLSAKGPTRERKLRSNAGLRTEFTQPAGPTANCQVDNSLWKGKEIHVSK